MKKPVTHRRRAVSEGTITIRHSSEVDRVSLARLAQLDDQDVPSGEALLAYVGEELRAAMPLRGRRVIADPFHLTGDVIELLRFRARQERKAA
jgi:hypothetical protein